MSDDLVMLLRKISGSEFSPTWQAAARIEALEAERDGLREALEWYRGNVSWCNKFGREGTEARDRLAKDIGKRAEAALAKGESSSC